MPRTYASAGDHRPVGEMSEHPTAIYTSAAIAHTMQMSELPHSKGSIPFEVEDLSTLLLSYFPNTTSQSMFLFLGPVNADIRNSKKPQLYCAQTFKQLLLCTSILLYCSEYIVIENWTLFHTELPNHEKRTLDRRTTDFGKRNRQ